jgi:hypothetical protein
MLICVYCVNSSARDPHYAYFPSAALPRREYGQTGRCDCHEGGSVSSMPHPPRLFSIWRRIVSCVSSVTYVTLTPLNEYSFSGIVADAGVAEKSFMRGAGTDRSGSRPNAAPRRRLAEDYWTADILYIVE